MIGQFSARIEYNSSLEGFLITNKFGNITAYTDASHLSYALGKQNWTITNDNDLCSPAQYTIEMKLTGCKDYEFTCDDGQCVKMEERCNQIYNCEDESDEKNCKIIHLKDDYDMGVIPISNWEHARPVQVKVSLILSKVIAIVEMEHSIQLKFQISLDWKETRATYHNLKHESFQNALPMEDIERIWLPLVIYTNTEQQETTRLGVKWEWSTTVLVKREGPFKRSSHHIIDEIEIFRGDENSLSMVQSYTHEFLCVLQLEKYPFDTQVSTLPNKY